MATVWRRYAGSCWEAVILPYPRKALWLQLDYINMCRQMEIPFERFPKYVKKAHDDVSAKFEVKKNEYLIRAFAKKVEELREVRMENGRYQIRCPKSLEELILEGRECTIAWRPMRRNFPMGVP